MCMTEPVYTHESSMRTNIEIDDKLMKQAQRLSGLKTKRAVIDAALEMFVRVQRQKDILKLAGKIHWEGNLDEMRENRSFDDSRR
jgi:Arc/MetJ family transcription regulator